MAWYPGAIRKEVHKHRTSLSSRRGLCLHVAVSEASSLFGYFNSPNVSVCSHFYVRRDGTVEQYVDTKYCAPANLQGNTSLISVETQGGVKNADSEPWTSAQREALARLAAWCNTTHGIPLQLMPNSKPSLRGICYHKQGVDPYRVSGGEKWSSVYGKICPGQGKINQIPGIISRAKAIVGERLPDTGPPQPPEPPKDWFDLATKKDLEEVVRKIIREERDGIATAVWNRVNPTLKTSYGNMVRFILNGTRPDRAQDGGVVGIAKAVADIPEKVWRHRARSYISNNNNTMEHALLYTQESANRLRQTSVVERPNGNTSSYHFAISQIWKLVTRVAEAQAEGRVLSKAEVEELTAAVVEAVPAGLASDVADELGVRLAPVKSEGTAA